MAKFVEALFGCMNVCPLQIRLYQMIDDIGKYRQTTVFDGNELIERMQAKYQYRRKLVADELERLCYASVLVQRAEPCLTLPKQGKAHIESIFAEAKWQIRAVGLRIIRTGADRFTACIRDSSFLTERMRAIAEKHGLKPQPIFMLKRSRMKMTEISVFVDAVIQEIANQRALPDIAGNSRSEQIVKLISVYGKYWPLISEKYVHYLFPSTFSWVVTPAFEMFMRAVLAIGIRPVEWRGHPFRKEHIFDWLDANDVNGVTEGKRGRCFDYLLRGSFIRPSGNEEAYSIAGATRFPRYFQYAEGGFSQLAFTLKITANGTYICQTGAGTTLSREAIDDFKAAGAKIDGDYFVCEIQDEVQLRDIIANAARKLTVWKKVYTGANNLI